MLRPLALACLLTSPAAGAEFSIDITQTPEEEFGQAATLARAAGATVTSLSLPWDAMTDPSGAYAPDIDWPTIAAGAYPALDLDLTVTLSLIDTLHDRRPAALGELPWDHPEVIAAATDLTEQVLTRIADLDLHALSIGNEIDGVLRTPEEIAAFARLLAATLDTAHRLRPGLPVGSKITFAGLTEDSDRWTPILNASTALQVTYYPLTADFRVPPQPDPAADLDTLIALADGRPVQVLEAGLPSGGCGGSEAGQRTFVLDLLDAAEARPQVTLVSLTWLTDLPAAMLDTTRAYYSIRDRCFVGFLETLGLRDRNGTPKPALQALIQRATDRN